MPKQQVARLWSAWTERSTSTHDVFDEARAGARRMAQIDWAMTPSAETAWEQPGPIWLRWALTVRQMLVTPQRMYRRMTAARWGGALGFAGVQLALATVVLLADRILPSFTSAQFGLIVGALEALAVAAVVATVAFAASLAISRATAQMLIKRRVRWAAVGRVLSYALAPIVIAPVPVVGWPVAIGWSVALQSIGYARMMRTSRLASVAIAVAPLLVGSLGAAAFVIASQ